MTWLRDLPTRWTSGADQSILGQGCQVLSTARPAILVSKSYLTLNFHGELLERPDKIVIGHRVRKQWPITLIGQKASYPSKGLVQIIVLRGRRK